MLQTSTGTSTTKQNKIFLIIFLSGLLLQACQHDPSEQVSRELLAGFRLSLKQRFEQGDTLPHSWTKLKEVLPPNLDGFEAQKANGGTFSPGMDRFSAVSQFFTDKEGKYLFVKLSDYAADSSAFDFWLKARPHQTLLWPGESETIIIEDKEEGLIHRTSAIHGSRFQIHLATNHPRGQQLLRDALDKLNWKSLNQ